MIVRELIARLGLTPAAGAAGVGRAVRGGYCGDLLSEVMANAPAGCVWATVQGHQNIVAVAVLREMAAVVVAGGRPPDAETLARADQEGIPLLTAKESVYALVGRLHAIGIGEAKAD